DDADKSESVNGRTDIHTRRCELVEMLQLDESKKIEDLSLGNLKKVGIILALMHQPKLLILDEPTSGLDPIMQNKFYDLLLEEKKKGTTIFYSTHILSEVSKICDRVGIIRNGNLIKIEDVDSMSSKRLTFVTIISDDVSEIKQNMDIKITEEEGNKIRFANNMEDDKLIKQLSKYKIDKILIEEATLEDMFMHYYTEEK
ncbi:MAG: ABC transporter ATP-binding protein, partial [Lachnospiraceae bacterium]|nr:ABC transporter ATP-binding protein [Lachnospiraceae bacterium]